MSGDDIPPLEQRPEAPAIDGVPLSVDAARPPGRRHRRVLAWAGSIAAHLMVFGALFWPRPAAPPQETPAIQVSLVETPKPDALPGPPGPPAPPGLPNIAAPREIRVSAPRIVIKPTPPRHAAPSPDAESQPMPDTFSDVMSESELAGALTAGEGEAGGGGGGGGGGGCDMARAVQQALRRDPLVGSAVSQANRRGKSIMLWNGDWVRAGIQDGKGLSAVREAVMWEVAFSPAACRNRPVHGLVLLSLADGGTRFAIGSGAWRWSDLLGVRQ
jgi:hypothetical protein